MPTLNRIEFLALSLERIRGSWEPPDDIRIFLDTASVTRLDEVERVRDLYFPTALIFRAGQHEEAPSGCWNILNAIKSGYETGSERIYLIEEDVLIYPDYFLWHRKTQQESPALATCGRRWPYYKSDFYTNPGSCLSRRFLTQVVPHINDEFFADRRGYMNRVFGEMDEASDLDDGLMRRVLRQVGGTIRYPDSPVCAHQGFWAYQKFAEYKVNGTIDERIEQLRKLLPTVVPGGRYTRDFEPYQWSRQRGLNERPPVLDDNAN